MSRREQTGKHTNTHAPPRELFANTRLLFLSGTKVVALENRFLISIRKKETRGLGVSGSSTIVPHTPHTSPGSVSILASLGATEGSTSPSAARREPASKINKEYVTWSAGVRDGNSKSPRSGEWSVQSHLLTVFDQYWWPKCPPPPPPPPFFPPGLRTIPAPCT